MPLPTTVEPLPQFYENSRATQEAAGNQELAMLENLRGELMWGRTEAARAQSLYSVARNIGDAELFKADETGMVSSLLDGTRYEAGPHTFIVEMTGQTGNLAGKHTEDGELTVNFKRVDEAAVAARNHFESIGMPFLKPTDEYLSAFLHVAAHESGHAILKGISRAEKSVGGGEQTDRRLATRTYLGQHPEEAVTGNWETDTQIREEQFAEGYAQVVVRRALRTLGYEEAHIDAIIDYQGPGFSWSEVAADEHQLDHLDKVTADMPINRVMASVIEDEAKLKDSHQTYRGELGYALPLSKDKVVGQIVELTRIIKDREFADANPNGTEWENKVKTQQSEEVKTSLAELQQRRFDLLNPAIEKDKKLSKMARSMGRTMLHSVLPRRKRITRQ